MLTHTIEPIFHQCYSHLCNYATKIVADKHVAEDIVIYSEIASRNAKDIIERGPS